jgi:hypothetical protein
MTVAGLDRDAASVPQIARSRTGPIGGVNRKLTAPRSALASVPMRSPERRYGACPLGTTPRRRVRLDLRARFHLSIEVRAPGAPARAVVARVHGCTASDGDADSRWFGSSKSACKYAGSLGASDEPCRATVHSLSKVRPRIRRTSERTTRRNPLVERASDEAADGTRTHDLLHGKQWLSRVVPLTKRIRGVGDSRGLPAIAVDSGNELVMVRADSRSRRRRAL